jgi:hypothetical protein
MFCCSAPGCKLPGHIAPVTAQLANPRIAHLACNALDSSALLVCPVAPYLEPFAIECQRHVVHAQLLIPVGTDLLLRSRSNLHRVFQDALCSIWQPQLIADMDQRLCCLKRIPLVLQLCVVKRLHSRSSSLRHTSRWLHSSGAIVPPP